MAKARAIMAAIVVLGSVGCVASPPEGPDEPVFGAAKADPALSVSRSETRIEGTLVENGMEIRFESVEVAPSVVDVRIWCDGMILSAHDENGEQVLAGVTEADGSPTILTDADRVVLRRLLSGLEAELYPSVAHVTSKEQYDEVRHLTLAEEQLFRLVDSQWSRWPSTLPLERKIGGDAAQGWTSWRRYAATNTTVTGCHDCNVCSFAGDCCDTGKKLGEYFAGDNYGNCGTSATGSQFTKDCTNHDQCVRTSKHGGHALASAYCDDQFTSCVDDNSFAASCNYDWRGTTKKGNCPTSYNGDGKCDCFCQFQDSDC